MIVITSHMKQTIVSLDLEGVLVPEIWIAVAEKTGIEALRRTTRDEPDYDLLMRGRLDIMRENDLKLSDIQDVIGSMSPLDGAKDFLDELRAQTQVVILSDTFVQFANPLMRQLDWPTIFCNHLEVSSYGRGRVVHHGYVGTSHRRGHRHAHGKYSSAPRCCIHMRWRCSLGVRADSKHDHHKFDTGHRGLGSVLVRTWGWRPRLGGSDVN